MEFNVKDGMSLRLETTVSENDTASKYASGAVEVYATPAMIGFMENTAKNCVDGHLPEGYTTVGTEVNVKHLKATPIGMKITCEATITKAEGKKVVFKVEAWDEKGKIGEGTHCRYIVNIEEFMKRISS